MEYVKGKVFFRWIILSQAFPHKFLQLAAALHGCATAICDKVKPSAESSIQAVVEFITKRGHELQETDISRLLMHELITTFKYINMILLKVYLHLIWLTQNVLTGRHNRCLQLRHMSLISIYARKFLLLYPFNFWQLLFVVQLEWQ